MSTLMWVLLIFVLIALLGGGWGWRAGYYGPGWYGGGLGFVVLVVLILVLLGRV